MKLMVIFFSLFVGFASAEPITGKFSKEVECTVLAELMKEIGAGDWGQPQWSGKTKNSKVILVSNAKNGKWALIELADSETGCPIAVGAGYEVSRQILNIPQPPKPNPRAVGKDS